MSQCEQVSRADAYHDGELSADSRAAFERHLARCEQCQAELAGLRKLTQFISSSPRPGMPPGAMARLHKAVDRQGGPGIVRFAEELAAAAAAVLVACVIALASRPASTASAAASASWETAAVAQQPAETTTAPGSDDQVANWIVQDLSGKGEHD
ncbi:MAG: anti-sigma factor [Phycisphaerae bacterium]